MRYLLLLTLLAGCAQPVVVNKPTPIDIPIGVECHISPVNKPTDLMANLTPKDLLSLKTKTVLADRENHLAYEQKLEAAIKVCQ